MVRGQVEYLVRHVNPREYGKDVVVETWEDPKTKVVYRLHSRPSAVDHRSINDYSIDHYVNPDAVKTGSGRLFEYDQGILVINFRALNRRDRSRITKGDLVERISRVLLDSELQKVLSSQGSGLYVDSFEDDQDGVAYIWLQTKRDGIVCDLAVAYPKDLDSSASARINQIAVSHGLKRKNGRTYRKS